MGSIHDTDYWFFQDLFRIIFDLADDPANVISRDSGRDVTDDLALDFDERLVAINERYSDIFNPELQHLITIIEMHFDNIGRGGPGFDIKLWTNEAFSTHKSWNAVRAHARDYINRIATK